MASHEHAGRRDEDRRLQAAAAAMSRARALEGLLVQRAHDTELARHVPEATMVELRQHDLFRILQPRSYGGAQCDIVTLLDIAATLARADASVAWTWASLASHAWMMGWFGAGAQKQVWGHDAQALIASSLVFPAGHARKVEGGFELSGHWPFATAAGLCPWILLGAIVMADDDADDCEYRLLLVPTAKVQHADNWDAMGLRGTGSGDVSVQRLLVPDAMSLQASAMAGGPQTGAEPLYSLPVFALYPFVLAGVALGNAEACLHEFTGIARQRAANYNRAKLADFPSIQMRLASAGAKVDAARRIMRGTLTEAMDAARAELAPDLMLRARYRRDGAMAVNLCTEAVATLFKANGASGLAAAHVMQRQFRDAQAIDAHIAFSFDAAGSMYGRVALGLPIDNPLLQP
ncbi:MAG: acyl-CoA dehydrogenase family protein [Hyphomicrobiales bacterium]|nr:acyl-CoA dehydrogenase family protein [Hyphomicrobiales bacterium]